MSEATTRTPASDLRNVPTASRTDLFIDGRWRPASAGGRFDVTDPATGATLATVADGSVEDMIAAVAAADAAQAAWAATAPRRRSDILRAAFDLMHARRTELAALMTAEMGKPLAESLGEVDYAAEYFRWFSEEAVRFGGSWRIAPDGKSRLVTMRQPIGPALLVTPWNFPLAMGTRKIGPALAAGCTTVIKPAQQTPLSMLALADLLALAGVPAGVVNVVPTTDARHLVAAAIDDGRIRKLSFTGSTGVGRALAAHAAQRDVRTSMELGGNAPYIVFADADLEKAASAAIQAKLRNNGEACTAANRILVERSVAGRFTELLVAAFATLRAGHGADAGTTIGPLIDEAARAGVQSLVDGAVASGATVAFRGEIPDSGSFYPVTVLTDVPDDAEILRSEIFGPVAPVVPFEDEQDAVDRANDTEFGLAAYVFTRDLDRAVRVGEALHAGMVAVNRGLLSNPAAPFGGVGASGHGREGGAEGIEEYVDVKYMAIDAS